MPKKQILMSLLFAAAFLTSIVFTINAQETNTNPEQKTEEIKNADLAITANITARELKFEIVPNPTVEFPGKPERATVWEAERQNLPKSVEPGVTYRNIGIQLRITSRFADIERIVAEALGEIPISDNAATENKPVLPSNPSNQKKPR